MNRIELGEIQSEINAKDLTTLLTKEINWLIAE